MGEQHPQGQRGRGGGQVYVLVAALQLPVFRPSGTGDLDTHFQRRRGGMPLPGALQNTVVP